MADIRDPARFLSGRWAWHAYGYEQHLNGCGFGDIDSMLECGGFHLFIECKDGEIPQGWTYPPMGQLIALRSLAAHWHTVWVLYGVAAANNPLLLLELGEQKSADTVTDWRALSLDERRTALHERIDGWWRMSVATREWQEATTR